MSIFEKAAKQKIRFNYRGLITTEDLYDLSRGQLNELYITYHKELKDQTTDGLITEPAISQTTDLLQLQLDLIKHVFEDKQNEAKAAQDAIERKKKKERIMAIIADKEDASLVRKSKADLQKMLDEL